MTLLVIQFLCYPGGGATSAKLDSNSIFPSCISSIAALVPAFVAQMSAPQVLLATQY